MARVRDAVGVLNGLGRVAVAYSAEVTREMGEVVSNVSNFLIGRSGGEEGGRGLPDDFPGWENFTAGEFSMGAEYNSPIATPPNAYHPKATHDATDSQTQEHSSMHQHHHTPPTDVLNHANGGERSFHSVASRGLSLAQVRAFHQRKARWLDLDKRAVSGRHYTTSGDTVVGPSATNDKTQDSHIEQQKKVRSYHVLQMNV